MSESENEGGNNEKTECPSGINADTDERRMEFLSWVIFPYIEDYCNHDDADRPYRGSTDGGTGELLDSS